MQSLIEAARQGDKLQIKRFIKKDGRKGCINFETDAFGQTALHIASEEGHLDLVAFLIDKCNAKVNVTDNSGWTPLFCACKWGRLKICEFLLQRGADANIKSNDKAIALHYFVRHDFGTENNVLVTKVLKMLMDNGAELNKQNMNGETALHIAAFMGSRMCVEFLLQNEANINATDR